MLAVNASYTTGLAYTDTIKNLCPNTYYEFSAWIRNICGVCGQDQNAKQTFTPGVLPNLAYAINGIDYYTTGNVAYTKTWVQKGFIYKTGPAETSFIISIKNNASGGGGNDWVLDDINLSTCYPNLIMNPNDTASVCAGFPVVITDTVKSYYSNFTFYQWEASINGGVSWVSVGSPGTAVPVVVNGLYQYNVSYIYNPAKIDSGHYIRIRVATTLSNLTNPNCSVANSQKVFLKVYSKCSTLETNILNFNGSNINDKNVLYWTTQNGEGIKEYQIEKSTDGVNFSLAGSLNSENLQNVASYTFTDPDITSNTNYYRLKIVSQNGNPSTYSKTILVYSRNAFFKISTINPFSNVLKVDIILPDQGKVELDLCDMYGKVLSKKNLQLNSGNSQVIFDNVSYLPSGMYILTAYHNGGVVQNKLIKLN